MRKDCMEISVIISYGPTTIADSVRMRTPDGEGYTSDEAAQALREGGAMVTARMADMLDTMLGTGAQS